MLMAAYSALLGLGLVVSAPWWLARMVTTQRYRDGLRQRLGKVPARLCEAVLGQRVVWVHAVSVGEVLAVSRLVDELETALNARSSEPAQRWRVVVSTTTRTGQALARERFGPERVFYFPLDFAWAVRAYLRALRPELLVLAESELWPRMLVECERRSVPVAVVNARVSDRSFCRSLRFRRVWTRMLRKVSLLLAQSEEDARRLVELGARAAAVRVSGNLKYDARAPKQSRMAELIREVAAGRPVIVAGSTVDDKPVPEESPVIHAWGGTLRERGVLLVLAPRHPERFDLVYSMAIEYPTLRATELLQGKAVLDEYSVRLRTGERRPVEIVVLDTIGDLAAVYGIANVAFVGGSLARRGGHSPLEPARYGVPVVMGPSFENFRDVVGKMQAAEAIRIVEDFDGLAAALQALLSRPAEARAMGERGRRVFEQEGGATARSIEALMQLVSAHGEVGTREAVSA